MPLAAAQEWVRVRLLRRPPTLTSVTAARSTSWTVFEGRATGVAWPDAADPPAVQVEYLQRAVIALHDRITEERRELDGKVQSVMENLSARISKADEVASETAEAVRSLATDSVRWEVFGLLCVALGSAISILPALLGWS